MQYRSVVSAALSALVSICSLGLVLSGRASAQYYVELAGSNGNGGKSVQDAWRTITHAARTAPTGSTIYIGRGHFGNLAPHYEAITVRAGKRLSFVGSGRDVTTVSNEGASHAVLAFKGSQKDVQATFLASDPGTVMNVSGLTVNGAGPQTAGRWLSCVAYADGAGGVVQSCALVGPRGDGRVQERVGLSADGRAGTPSRVQVLDTVLTEWSKCGILMGGGELTGVVRGCTIVGAQPDRTMAQNGIQLGAGGGGFLVHSNIVRDIWYEHDAWHSCGVLVHKTRGNDNLITGNRFFRCKTAFFHEAPGRGKTRFVDNVIGASYWGIYACSAKSESVGNRIDAVRSVEVRNASTTKIEGNAYGDFRANVGWPNAFVAHGDPVVRDWKPEREQAGFRLPVEIALGRGAAPSDLVLADFNGDGKLDFATADTGLDRVTIRYGSGGSEFSRIPGSSVRVRGRPMLLAAGEFSGTPGIDLAVATQTGKIRILTNDGAGRLQRTLTLDCRSCGLRHGNIVALARGNFDQQGQDDLAWVTGGGTDRSFLTVVGFRLGQSVAIDSRMCFSKVVDFAVLDSDQDGRDDIHMIAYYSPTTSMLQQWRYPNSLQYLSLLRGGLPLSIALVDLDGDAPRDIVYTTAESPATLHVLRRRLNQEVWLKTVVGGMPTSTVFSDMQGLSTVGAPRLDALVVDRGVHRLRIVEGFANGDFAIARSLRVGVAPQRARVADLDGDGLQDVLVCSHIGDSVSVAIAEPLATARSYGARCAGHLFRVPAIRTLGSPSLPTIGNVSFGLGVVQARANAACALFVSASATPSALPCAPQVGAPFLTLAAQADRLGAASAALPIPGLRSLAGVEIFAQWVVLDSNGQLAGRYALSDGLRLQLGAPR